MGGRRRFHGRTYTFNLDKIENDTYVASMIEERRPGADDDVGALYYVVAVILIYGCSILMMIASYIRKNNTDRKLGRYLKEMAHVRKRERQLQLLNAAQKANIAAAKMEAGNLVSQKNSLPSGQVAEIDEESDGGTSQEQSGQKSDNSSSIQRIELRHEGVRKGNSLNIPGFKGSMNGNRAREELLGLKPNMDIPMLSIIHQDGTCSGGEDENSLLFSGSVTDTCRTHSISDSDSVFFKGDDNSVSVCMDTQSNKDTSHSGTGAKIDENRRYSVV